jgi:hypothetical protein
MKGENGIKVQVLDNPSEEGQKIWVTSLDYEDGFSTTRRRIIISVDGKRILALGVKAGRELLEAVSNSLPGHLQK